jgi:hypothetical protein
VVPVASQATTRGRRALYRQVEWCWHCADHAAEHVLKATGRDIWAELGGSPKGWREAADLFRRLGVASFKDAISKTLGEPVRPSLARRGDLVMVDNALGICRGELAEFLDHMQPMRRAECAWRL